MLKKMTMLSTASILIIAGCHSNSINVENHEIEIVTKVETQEQSLIETEVETILIVDESQKNTKEENTKPVVKPTTKPTVNNTQNNNSDEEFINYSLYYNVGHKLLNDKLEVSYLGKSSGEGNDLKVGVMAFANGIPQIIEYKNERDYFANITLIDNIECEETLYWDNYEDGEENITMRYATMMLPDLIVKDGPGYIPHYYQSLSDGNPQVLENKILKQTENIKDKEGEADYSGKQVHGFEGLEERIVLNREGLERFIIRTSREESQCGDYILSFWGDGKPIQVGESMYYRVNLPAWEPQMFVFDMDAEQLKSITNFYYILAPEDDSKIKTISKGSTYIFSDKVSNN